MLKANISTRPFYNDRLVSAVILAIAAAGLALTAFNVTQVMSVSAQRATMTKVTSENVASTKAIDDSARALNATINVPAVTLLDHEVRKANDLIDQRTFSWTVFFSVIEKTLPYDARLVSVTPKVEKGVMYVGMLVVAQTPEATQKFIVALDKTGVFIDTRPANIQHNDDGTDAVQIEAVYRTTPKPAAAPAQAPPPAPKTGKRGKP